MKFSPVLDQLYVQVTVTESGTSMTYWYRDRPDDEFHFKSVCEMGEYVVRPHFGGHLCTATNVAGVMGTAQSPVVIYNRLCSWEDLCAIRDLWEKKSSDPKRWHNSFPNWIREILDDQQIPLQIRERLAVFQGGTENSHAGLAATVETPQILGLYYSMLAGSN